MKSNTKPIFMFIFFTLILSSFAATSAKSDSGQQIALLYLAKPTILKEVLTEMTNHDVNVLAFQHQQRVDNKIITDGFYLTPEERGKVKLENDAIQERYWQSYGAALADLSSTASLDISNAGNDQEASALQEHIATLDKMEDNFLAANDCWVDHACPDIDVVSLLILGDNTALSRLDSQLIKQIDTEFLGDESDSYASTPMPLTTSFPYETWVPNRGTINIYPSGIPGERFVENRMYWDTASRLSAFGWNSTYEHDFLLNNSSNSGYGPGTYLSNTQDYLGVPIVSYWISDLPSPYLDTRFGDPDYVKAFTIGSADAGSIQPMEYYYYYIRTPNGNANTDNGYLLAQIGQRTPDYCYTTWCVFGTQAPESIYPSYKVDPIPNSFFWIATFQDVSPYHWAAQNIDWLYSSSVTSGCATNPLRYCPASYVTRAQMAVFLLKGIHGSSYWPPNPTGIFSDVPTSHWAARWIEQLYLEGITGGCGVSPLRYCPESNTTHAQMSVFLLRSKYGRYYSPPSASGSLYSDVPYNHWAASWIEQATYEGIFDAVELNNDGCPSGYFCPETPVTRALMAGWLVRTFNLP